MNLSGQAIYAPKKVYLSKSSSDCTQAAGDEKTEDSVNSQAVTDNMFELQSQKFLSLFGQPNTTPKPFYTPSSPSGQFIVNSSTGCGHQLYMGNEIDQQTANYLPQHSSYSHGLGLLSSVISSTGPNQLSSANSSFEGRHSFATASADTGKLSSACYSKESGGQLCSENVSPVSASMNQVTSVNTRPVPPLNSSEVPYVNASQASSVNGSQVSFERLASSFGQNVDPYNTCQFLSPKNLEVTGSGQALSGSCAVAIDTEATGNSGRVENLNDSKYVEQLSGNTGNSNSVSQSPITCSTARCDSTQSPLTFNEGFVNSPESWTFSPLVPFSLSHDNSYDECAHGSPFTGMPEVTSQSTLDELQNDVKSSVSDSKDMSSSKCYSSTVQNRTEKAMTWAQKYGININAKQKTSSRQSFSRISLADIEEFSGKIVPGKRKSVETCSSNNKLLGPSEPKQMSTSPREVKYSSENHVDYSSSVILSSSQVSSTDMNQEHSLERSRQGQNRIPSELSPMPSSTSEISAVPPKMYGICEEDSNEISSSGSVMDYVQNQGSTDTYCQVCGDKAAGFYCGAFICEACKKFFMRANKLEKLKYVCLRVGRCVITKESRVQCQYCRYQKCVSLKMYCPGTGDSKKKDKKIGEIPCRVCSAPSSGFHFGALTCEGCKGFFRRMAKERECQRYKCSKNGSCEVNTITRNLCKACRYRKCVECGMSIEGSRIGRQPNSVKHAISIEAEKQGKTQCKEQVLNDGINISDMEAMVNAAIPATVEELAQITSDIQPQQFDVKEMKGEVKISEENKDLETTPLPLVPVEIKQEPQSPMATITKPFTLRSSCSGSSIVDSISCEKTFEILDKCADCNEELEHLLPVIKNNEEDELAEFTSIKSSWVNMMSSFEFTARKLIKFSKKVPGFRAISLDDQIKLIQASIYPIVVLNCSRSFDNETKQFSYFNYTPRQRETIQSFFPMLKILSSHFIHTGTMVKLMNFSSMEYTFLSILLLLNADVENLEDSERVRKLLLDTTFALQYHEETTYTDGSTRFGMLLVRLAELHFILIQHNTAITVMLKKNPELTLPQMYKEMFGEKVLEN
ncbi:probable GPI-anchored adhesin-like protein PGA55 [Mizuhopecten yessoensis]|uniref:Nuclear receptor ROR-beta n=1 Tax=Mizuhopecten yessoensis TaxID=6573 RepID=A0A210Q547_MIZYE|nr:probable GPI-anchored adhesin-like protein PGA55 [Mizuhopecten yessoensis]OWF43845.1 Nuclear receptor ROR-beta [Mizuhopecten yessoensis]